MAALAPREMALDLRLPLFPRELHVFGRFFELLEKRRETVDFLCVRPQPAVLAADVSGLSPLPVQVF